MISVFDNQPIVMDDKQNIHHDYTMMSIKRLLKHRISDFSAYNVKYSVTNIKFSTKCQWTKSN